MVSEVSFIFDLYRLAVVFGHECESIRGKKMSSSEVLGPKNREQSLQKKKKKKNTQAMLCISPSLHGLGGGEGKRLVWGELRTLTSSRRGRLNSILEP